jgi:hypothetical protein
MRQSTVLLSMSLLVSVAACAWLWNELEAEREHSAQLESRMERQISDVAPTSNPARTPDPAIAVAAPAASAIPASVSKELPAPAAGNEEGWQAYQRRLMSDPRYLDARRMQERVKFATRRANLIRLLGFTPEQADGAIDLDIDREFFWQRERTASIDSDAARAETRARSEAFERQQQDKLRALLGEENRARLQGYMESRESRMQVENLRSALGEAHALRDDQVEPLIAALHVERAQMQSELREFRDTLNWEGVNQESWRRFGERKIELAKSMNSRMVTSASSTLTRSQLEALDEQLQQEVARLEAELRLQQVQSKLKLPRTAEN